MRIFFALLFFFSFSYTYVLTAQNLVQDTLYISFKKYSFSDLPSMHIKVEDSREQEILSLGIYEKNEYWVIPVDLILLSEKSLSKEIQSMFPEKDSINFPHYKIEIEKYNINKNTNSLIYPHYVLNAKFNIYYYKESDRSKYLGSLIYENTIGENLFSENLNEGFESVVHSWQEDFVNDVTSLLENNRLSQIPLLENFRYDNEHVSWTNLYGGLEYIYGLKDNLIDGEIYFSNREAGKWFYRNGYGIRYRNSDNFESIEFGLSLDYIQYRINSLFLLNFKSQMLIGANNWKDYKTSEHEFYDAFIGDLSLSQSIVYNPLDKSSFIFGIGLSEDLTYIYSKGFRVNAGFLFHLGLKL